MLSCLVTTSLATMHESRDFGVLARLEAGRRGIRQTRQVVILGDGAAWIGVHDSPRGFLRRWDTQHVGRGVPGAPTKVGG